MSDDDRDIDIESEDDQYSSHSTSSKLQGRTSNVIFYSQAEKRAHHNALERKRRDHIKDSFTSLRDSVPTLQGEKVASRAQILKKAAEYISFMRRKNQAHQQDIDDLKRQNNMLETQIRQLERQRTTYEQGEMSDMKKDNHSSESDITDVEDEHTVETLKISPQQTVVSRRPAANGRKGKGLPANNSRLGF